MAHIRHQLRDWLRANLVGSADAGSRVEEQRALPLEKNFQPTFLFSVAAETSVDLDMDGNQQRTTSVRVRACVKDDSEAGADALDRMALFAEQKFAADPTLGGIARDYQYLSTEFDFNGNGERTLCTADMTFAVTLFTARAHPETAL